MAALSDSKLDIVRTLVESAPDTIVGGLQEALAEAGGDSVLASVRQLVEAEAGDRLLRNTIFQPVVPLCTGGGSSRRALVFPPRALALVWRGLKISAPTEIAAAEAAEASFAEAIANGQRPLDVGAVYDAVTGAAAAALRSSDLREFRAAVEACDLARPGGGEALAACLDLAPVVRRALPRLADWISHPGEETGAAARLAYKDAVKIAEDAGPRFFEMIAGQLSPPWMVLRIISAIMDKPTECYLANSELSGFPERLMGEIDEALKAIGKLDLDAGPDAARTAGALVALITQQTFELEICIELTGDEGWRQRIVGQKKALANLVEGRLREAEKLTAAALPMRVGSSRRRRGPELEERPEPRTVGRAMTLLTFLHEVRLCARYGGFSAAHTKATESLCASVESYVEEVLDHVRTGDVADVAIAHAYLRIAADVAGLIQDEKAAELIRRRASLACAVQDNSVFLDA